MRGFKYYSNTISDINIFIKFNWNKIAVEAPEKKTFHLPGFEKESILSLIGQKVCKRTAVQCCLSFNLLLLLANAN